MLDKRHLHGPIFALSLLLSGCLSIWFLTTFREVANIVNRQTETHLFLKNDNDSDISQFFPVNELPIDDPSTLIDMKDFEFTMNQDICNRTQPFLIILVHSAPGNFQKRNVIRDTWGRQNPFTAVLFLLGASDMYEDSLNKESSIYNDIVQGNFLDCYRNMTYKHVMALKWISYHCTNAKYVLKSDDDVFVNTEALLNFLRHGISPWGARRLILCDAVRASRVKRSWRSKWRVSPKEYPGSQYPVYCTGWAIIYSPDTTFLLYREAQKEPYFWIDDVHVTGTIAKKVNITQVPMKPMILTSRAMRSLIRQKPSEVKAPQLEFFFGPPDLVESDIRTLHNLVTRSQVIN